MCLKRVIFNKKIFGLSSVLAASPKTSRIAILFGLSEKNDPRPSCVLTGPDISTVVVLNYF